MCIRISKGSAKKTHFFTVGGGDRLYAYSTKHLQHLSLSQIIQRISTVPLCMIRSPNHSEGGDTELCEEVQSQEETGFWRSMFHTASPNPLYSSYVGLCAVRKSSRQVLDHMFNPFPQAGCRTLCKWTHHMSNAPSQYIQCVEHLSKCKRTWPICLLLLSPLLFINCSLFKTEPVFIQNVQRHITLAFAGLVRLIPELVFREICKSP